MNGSGLLDSLAENILRIQSALGRGCLLAQVDGTQAHLIQNLINKTFCLMEQEQRQQTGLVGTRQFS